MPTPDNILTVLEYLTHFVGPDNDAAGRDLVARDCLGLVSRYPNASARRRAVAWEIGYCLGLLERVPHEALRLFYVLRAPNPRRLFRMQAMKGWERGMLEALACRELRQLARRQRAGASGGAAKARRVSGKTTMMIRLFESMRACAPDAPARELERQVAERLHVPLETVRSAIKRTRRSKI